MRPSPANPLPNCSRKFEGTKLIRSLDCWRSKFISSASRVSFFKTLTNVLVAGRYVALSSSVIKLKSERATYLPATKTFVSVLKKDTLDADEMNLLLQQSRDLINLVPSNFLEQFGNGFAGLGR